jgi:YVTN family beta-propeller protein
VFAPDTVEPLARVETGKMALNVSSSPDGTIGYVTGMASNTLDVVDLTTLTGIARISTQGQGGDRPHGVVHIPGA